MHYLDDMQVGQTAAFGRYEVTRDEVIAFASRYDAQPFHLDDAAAATTPFGRLAASGWHTCAMMMSMVVEETKAQRRAMLGSPGVDELRWLKPVYPGDTLRVESEVVEITPSRSRPDMGSIRSRITVFNQEDAAVMTLIAIEMMRRRPA